MARTQKAKIYCGICMEDDRHFRDNMPFLSDTTPGCEFYKYNTFLRKTKDLNIARNTVSFVTKTQYKLIIFNALKGQLLIQTGKSCVCFNKIIIFYMKYINTHPFTRKHGLFFSIFYQMCRIKMHFLFRFYLLRIKM